MKSGNKRIKKELQNKEKVKVSSSAASSESVVDSNVTVFKEKVLLWLFSVLAAIVSFIFLAKILVHFYHPDIKALTDYAIKNTVLGNGNDPRPEPVEAALFRLGVVTMIPLSIVYYIFLGKIKFISKIAAGKGFDVVLMAISAGVVILAIIDFKAFNPFGSGTGEQAMSARDMIGLTNFDFYFSGLFIYDNPYFYFFILVPLLTAVFFFFRNKIDEPSVLKRVVSIIGFSIIAIAIVTIGGMNIFYFPYTYENKYDFNCVYYSMTQVYSGSPMLVDGFTNAYGLYPHFLNLIFKVIGLNVFHFTLVMSTLIVVSLVLNFYVAYKLVKNNIILLLGFASSLFLPYITGKILSNFDSYFATYPIRHLIPSVLLFLSYQYFTKRSIKLYAIIFVVTSMFILWNPEFGLVCYMAWLATNIFVDFYNSEGKVNVAGILKHIVFAIVSVAVVFGLYVILIKISYGTSPDISMLFGYMLFFAKYGMGLLPMALIHPWHLVVLGILLGFLYSGVNWFHRKVTPKVAIVFMMAIVTLGFFVYYQGRSHNWNLYGVCGFLFLMLTVLGDELWENIKKTRTVSLYVLFSLFLAAISFSFIEITIHLPKMIDLVYQDNEKDQQAKEQEQVNSNTDFILKNSVEGEKIMLFTKAFYDDLYYDGNKRKSAFNPGMEALVLNKDITKMTCRIRDSSFKVFIEPSLCNYQFLVKPVAVTAATYELTSVNRSMCLLKKRHLNPVMPIFFQNSPDLILHRKYDDDTTGFNMRVSDALGIGRLNAPAQFSVQLLFHTQTQIFSYASLIGNMDDTSGFLIANVLNSPNYFFGVNGKGSSISLPENQWVYCVANYFDNHIEITVNGGAPFNIPIEHPLKQSSQLLYIGNLGYYRYYLGPIAEVALSSNFLSSEQISATWKKISESMVK